MFLHDLLKQVKKDAEVTDEQLITYADTMVSRWTLYFAPPFNLVPLFSLSLALFFLLHA